MNIKTKKKLKFLDKEKRNNLKDSISISAADTFVRIVLYFTFTFGIVPNDINYSSVLPDLFHNSFFFKCQILTACRNE